MNSTRAMTECRRVVWACSAMLLAVEFLPRLIRAFEGGLTEFGVEIVRRTYYSDDAGAAVPVIVVRHGALSFQLELRNAFEDLLTEDREDSPVRLDARLDDEDYAAAKLAGVVRDRLEIVRAITGWNTSLWELMKAGERIATMARVYNLREGLTADDDRLPERFFTPPTAGPLHEDGVAIDPHALEKAKHLYYQMMGWDRDTGVPHHWKLEELDIGWTVEYLP